MVAIKRILLLVCVMWTLCSHCAAVAPLEADTTIIDTFICRNSVYVFGGDTITETGTYTTTYTSSAGLDSTVVLYLSVEECDSAPVADEPKEKTMKSNMNCEKVIYPHPTFGPGSDESGAYWVIDNIEMYNNEVSIYDRWGKLLYVKKNYTNSDGWDGTFRGMELPSTDYWYAISLGDLGRICYGHFYYKKNR